MKAWKKHKRAKNNTEQNSRINVMMAIIFVLGLGLIVKLYDLQILNYKKYFALAARQQQIKSKLEPARGRIFIEDKKSGLEDGELFPLATNKQFALVFAKPNIIVDAQKTANDVYAVLNQNKVENEVNNLIANDQTLVGQTDEFKNVKRELEIKNRKEKIIADYLILFSKKNDPYEPIAKNVDEETVKKLKSLNIEGIDYTLGDGRFYPEKNIGAHFLGFVGYVGDSREGRYGLEGFFDRELSGSASSVLADRNAIGDVMVLSNSGSNKPQDGSDLFLTINRSIQFDACQKLSQSVKDHGAEGGSVVVIDPKTGAILAMCSVPDFDPNDYKNVENISVYNNPVIFSQIEPGSTFKSITMAAALDQDKITPATTYMDNGSIMVEGWPKPIKNSDSATFGGHGVTTMNVALEKSLNVGAITAEQKVGTPIFADYVKKFGFGEKTGIELETESAGNISNLTVKNVRPVNAATASFGQGITVTPLQMINSYVAIANGGILMKPYLVKDVVSPDGEKSSTQPKQIRRVISSRAASLLTGMLVNAVENGHAKKAKVPGYYVAGKTGTAQVASATGKGYDKGKTIQSFIGFAPANDPKFVMMTLLNNPTDKFAESSAVPLFGDIAKFVLEYYQIPTERNLDEK